MALDPTYPAVRYSVFGTRTILSPAEEEDGWVDSPKKVPAPILDGDEAPASSSSSLKSPRKRR